MKKINIKSAVDGIKNVFLAAFIFGSLGAYFMHQVDVKASNQTQDAVQAALKAVPVAQASKANAR